MCAAVPSFLLSSLEFSQEEEDEDDDEEEEEEEEEVGDEEACCKCFPLGRENDSLFFVPFVELNALA